MASMYILFSPSRKRFYVGSTNDLCSRIKFHQEGHVRSSKPFRPWILVYHEEFLTRGEAKKREYQVKAYKGGRAFKRLVEGRF